VVIGLLTDVRGCPVAVEVFPGNTQDAATVEGKVKELRRRYGVSEVVLAGDRGMVTASNEEKPALLPEAEGLKINCRACRSHPAAGRNRAASLMAQGKTTK